MKKLLVLVLAISFVCVSQAQDYHKNYFYGTIKYRGGGGLFSLPFLVASFSPQLNSAIKQDPTGKLRWLFYSMDYDFHIPGWTMACNGNDDLLEAPKWWRWLLFGRDPDRDYNLSYGYEVTWLSKVLPIGAYLGLDYEWRQVRVKDGHLLSGRHSMQAILPSAGIRYHLLGTGFEERHNWNIVLEGGASYNYVTKYRNFFNWGKDALNNGVRIRLGLAINTQKRGAFYVRWEHDTYPLFNTDFTLPDGGKPFGDIRNDFNSVMIGWALSM